MLIIRPILGVIILIVMFLSQSATAQGTSGALDTKNGFRDAKFGMLLSAFKGMVSTGTTVAGNGRKTIEYKRLSDVLRIGDIKLISISYTFYNDKLYYISIVSDEEERAPLQNTFTQAYGKPRQLVKADNPDLFDLTASLSKYYRTPIAKPKGHVWDGSKVKLTIVSTDFLGKKACRVIMISKVIDREISRYDAEETRRQSKKRAADI
jgi:hypothetical protein